jgi:hypothetical protein
VVLQVQPCATSRPPPNRADRGPAVDPVMNSFKARLFYLIDEQFPELYACSVHWISDDVAEVWMVGPGVPHYRWLACFARSGRWTLSPRG